MNNMEWNQQWQYDVDASGEDNSPIELHQALTRDKAQFLLEEEGYPINRQTKVTGSTALVQALKEGRDEVADYLLECKCDPNLATIHGDSPLHIAVSTNNKELVIKLINSKANPYTVNIYGQTILHKSVHSNHTNNLLPILLECTEDNDHINKLDIKGRSALRCASGNKVVDQEKVDYDPLYNVELLLRKGANPNLVCLKGLSPLHVATHGQFQSTVEALLHFNANVHIRTIEDGYTALQIASQKESFPIIRILVDNHSDPNTIDNRENTVLHTARNLEILQYFLSTTSVDHINLTNTDGNTPLHMITGRCDGIDMVQTIVDANEQLLYVLNNHGQTCLHSGVGTIRSNRLDMIKKLVDLGVDLMAKDDVGRTALDCISERDIESRQHLQNVMETCSNRADFKRANMNTDNDNDEEEEDTMGSDENKTW